MTRFLCLVPLVCVVAGSALADPLTDALSRGKPFGDFRYRIEAVDQDGFARDAFASTLRSRLGYETGALGGVKALLEFEDIWPVGDDRFNSTTNGRVQFPIVADPKTTEVNRAQLRYDGDKVDVTLGRQRLVFDNQRFVGNVGFRQNEQTFDAARLDISPVKDALLSYTYVWRVNRVFGKDNPQGRLTGDTHLLNGNLKLGPGTLAAYAYLVDARPLNAASSKTFGVRYAGAADLGDKRKLTYVAEYAHQADAQLNPFDYGLDYVMVEAGGAFDTVGLRAGYELLAGNGRIGFATPLATLHAFQGFADAFLTTPASGIQDRYLVAETTFKFEQGLQSLRLAAWYHDYARDAGRGSLGDEINLVVAAKISDRLSAELKYADYDGAGGIAGRRKVWASVTVTF
jgi:hypothetical protein